MTSRSYLSSVVTTITGMHASGTTSMTWQEIIEQRVAPNPASQAEVNALLGSSGDRRVITDMLIEEGLLAVQTNDRYTTEFLLSKYASLNPPQVRQWLALFGAGAGTGLRICEDSTDPFWIAKQMDEQTKFGGGVRARNDLSLDVAARDGNIGGAKDVIETGMRAAYPDATNDQVKTVLGTTAPKMLSNTLK